MSAHNDGRLTTHVPDMAMEAGFAGPAFLDVALACFRMIGAIHYRVPLLLSPHSCSTNRGS